MSRPLRAITRDVRMWASRALVTSLAPPDWLTVNLTLRCNLQCVMCTTCYDSPELSTREVLDLIDQAAAWGVGVFNPLGGEPFIRADLEAILSHAAQRDMHTTLTTNGTLIRPDRAAQIARIPIEKLHINISLDGPEAAHDLVRGAGTWKRTMAGYRSLREADEAAGNPSRKICANVILHRKNLDGFIDFVRELADLGFDGVQVLNLFRSRDDDTVGGLWFDPASISELERVCEALTAEGVVLNAPGDLRLIPRYYREGLAPLDAPCWAGWKELYINADGSAIMCDGKLDFLAGRFGSVREHTLRQLWTSTELKKRRSVVKTCTTPCIQNCYLRRDSDRLLPLGRELAAFGRGAAGLRPRAATTSTPLTLELCDTPSDPESETLMRLFARSPVPFAALVREPERFHELRDLHYLDFGRGFLGIDAANRMLDAAANAGIHFATLRLDWRGDPLLHPDLWAVLAALAPRADRVWVQTSGLLWRAPIRLPANVEFVARPALAGSLAPLALQRARAAELRINASEPEDGPAISWEGRLTASRADRRLSHRVGDALKEPFGPLWARAAG